MGFKDVRHFMDLSGNCHPIACSVQAYLDFKVYLMRARNKTQYPFTS